MSEQLLHRLAFIQENPDIALRFGQGEDALQIRQRVSCISPSAQRQAAEDAQLDRRAAPAAILCFSEGARQFCDSFVELALSGYLDDTEIHRVVPNFVVQAGDPTGTGLGDPGYTLRCEVSPIPYERGTVGMALSGKDTGGSQFFVTLSRQPHLDGNYTVFGRVTSGMETVDLIEEGDKILGVTVLTE